MGFFDRHERFYSTSKTSPLPHRLNSRFDAIIAHNHEFLAGKRVLDIASHDGRWSFAALSAGAAHVHGIEPREELIAHAQATFSHYGVDDTRYSFARGDVFDLLKGAHYDVVLCLGFYYHTIRHAELLDLIERTGAQLVVIDTEVTPYADEMATKASDDARLIYGNPYGVQLLRDPVDDEQMAWSDSMTRNGHTIVGRPSRAAVDFLAKHFGYRSRRFDWRQYLAEHPEAASSMFDYADGWRDTFYLSRE